jgi:hypothetical protein
LISYHSQNKDSLGHISLDNEILTGTIWIVDNNAVNQDLIVVVDHLKKSPEQENFPITVIVPGAADDLALIVLKILIPQSTSVFAIRLLRY